MAFDPRMEGRDYTDFIFAIRPDGKVSVFRYHYYWTPELVPGISAMSKVKEVVAAAKKTATGINYEIRIPLKQLYPLELNNGSKFGFSWLVNDNDGQKRKYIQWSAGIGATKDASLFGLIKCIAH